MAEINLAPGSEYAGLLRKRRRRLHALAVLVSLGIALVWGGFFVFEQQLVQNQRELDSRLASVEAEITRLGDQGQRVTLFEKRLAAVDALLTRHITWDPFFQDLERLLPPPTLMSRLKAILHEGTLELTGVTPDLDIIAQTLASLVSSRERGTFFTSGTLQSVNRLQQENPAGEVVSVQYDFGATLTFDPKQLEYGRQ